MIDKSSSSDEQFSIPPKAKVSRWFKSVMNIVRFKAKGSKGFIKISESDSSTDIPADDSCSNLNVTIDSAADALAQCSSTSNSTNNQKVWSSKISSNCANQSTTSRVVPCKQLQWNRPSTSYIRPKDNYKESSEESSSGSRSTNSTNESSTEDSTPKSSYYRGFVTSSQSKFNRVQKMQLKRETSPDSSMIIYSPSYSKSESDPRAIKFNKRSFLMANENSDSWSLHYGEVSPKILEDSFELIRGEIYEPLKRVRMEYDDNVNPEQKDMFKDEEDTEPEKPNRTYGILAFEESPKPHDMKSCPFKEVEKFFCHSRKLAREIYGTLVTIKDWGDFLRDQQFVMKNFEKLLESFQKMKNLLNPTLDMVH